VAKSWSRYTKAYQLCWQSSLVGR